jgi:phytoene synthase
VVDECRDEGVARAKLAWWRSEVERLYEGAPQHPVTLALREAIEPYRLPREVFEEILDGMEMDLGYVRYDDYKRLHLYCHRVAGVVGEASALIFGVTDRATLKYAHRLGLAFQLTNILRDVGEDARRGRIYLPLDELTRFGVSEADILRARPSPAFVDLMRFQYERASSLYDEALALLPQADRKTQRPGLMMAAIYRRLLEEVKDDGFRVLEHRIRLTPLTKLWLAWQTWWRER